MRVKKQARRCATWLDHCSQSTRKNTVRSSADWSSFTLAGTGSSYDGKACSLTTTCPNTFSSRPSNALSKAFKNNGWNCGRPTSGNPADCEVSCDDCCL